jgi:hypothetical protein
MKTTPTRYRIAAAQEGTASLNGGLFCNAPGFIAIVNKN